MNICGLMKTTLLDFPGQMACTVFTGGCNYRCPFCHNPELLEFGLPPEYSEEEFFSFLEKRRRILSGVAITGGEPTLQPDLPDFIRRIRGEFRLLIKLDTNGINPEMIKSLAKEKLLDYIAMDIKAGPENYALACGAASNDGEASGKPGLFFDRITATKDFLLKGTVPYEFRTTVVGGLHTKKDFEGIARFIGGADRYYLQCYKDSGSVLDRSLGFREPTADELRKYRSIVSPFVKSIDIRGTDIEL